MLYFSYGKEMYRLKTEKLSTSNKDIARAAALLKGGGLVAFPTETVYGLGANALDGSAVEKIFKAKGRPSDNPLIVHIYDINQVSSLVLEVNDNAKRLMEAFWPGPITIVMKKSDKIPSSVSAGLDTVGVRMPENPVALRFLKACGVPVAAPSANTSGKPSPTLASHVAEDLDGKIDAIIDGGQCSVGLESTVIDVSSEVPMLLRPGGITFEQLTEVLGHVVLAFECKEGAAPRSPGLKYQHYSPSAPVYVVRGDFDEYVIQNSKKYEKVGVITSNKADYPSNCIVKRFDSEPASYAANLFAYLRSLDGEGVQVIFAQDIDCKGINLATNNRLYKAAGYKIANFKGGRLI